MSSDFAQAIGQRKQLLEIKRNTIVTIASKPTVNNFKGYKCSPAQVDYVVDNAAAQGLLIPSNRGWHCQVAYKLGSEIYERCAAQARADGKVPAKLFTFLLNLELKKAPPEAER